jgi:hypothetical protein
VSFSSSCCENGARTKGPAACLLEERAIAIGTCSRIAAMTPLCQIKTRLIQPGDAADVLAEVDPKDHNIHSQSSF